jgi:PAS domain S-box-containing protein
MHPQPALPGSQVVSIQEPQMNLAESEGTLRAILERLPVGVGVADRQGRIRLLNPAGLALHGFRSLDEMLVHFEQYRDQFRLHTLDGREIPPDQWPLARALRNEPVENDEVRLQRVGGQERIVSYSAVPIPDAQGRNGDIVFVMHDTTQRRAIEQSLRESEERFRAMAELSPVAIMVNARGLYVYANAAAASLFGAPSAESLIGRSPYEFLDPADHEVVRSRIRTVLVERKPAPPVRYRWKRLDGSLVDVEVSAAPISWGGESAAQVLATDISERRRAEEALREADRRKDEFLATLAHELRNPLAAIRSAADLLTQAASDPGAVQRMASIIERQSSHLTRLIDDLMDISRISRGKIQLRRRRVALASLLDQAVDTVREHCQRLGHQLLVDRDRAARAIHLFADPLRLTQVLSNLLSNACKFTPPAPYPGRIEVTVSRCDDAAVIVVKDNGRGIPPENLQSIFDLFVQVDHLAMAPQAGLGIGLSLVKRLVEMHEGRIEAHSQGAGQGAEFVLTLPLLDDAAAEAGEPALAGPPATVREPSKPAGRRIIVVDDNVDVATALAMLLELSGHEVGIAHDGAEALHLAPRFAPDAMLIDIGMPGMDGHELCRHIRREPWGRDLFLAALTGWGQEEDRRRSAEAGFNAHLVKPVTPDAIERLLDQVGARAAAELASQK